MKKLACLFVVVAVVCAFATAGFAAEAKDPVQYSGNVVTGSVKTVGEAAEGTTKAAVSPIEALWNFLTGKGKPEKIVTDPVNKSGDTIYKAGQNTDKTVKGRSW